MAGSTPDPFPPPALAAPSAAVRLRLGIDLGRIDHLRLLHLVTAEGLHHPGAVSRGPEKPCLLRRIDHDAVGLLEAFEAQGL
jgi:hypothetical protein